MTSNNSAAVAFPLAASNDPYQTIAWVLSTTDSGRFVKVVFEFKDAVSLGAKTMQIGRMSAYQICPCGRNHPHARMASEAVEAGEVVARQFFQDHGIVIADWARSRGYSPRLVYAVLSGTRKCLRGQSHQIAKELGMK